MNHHAATVCPDTAAKIETIIEENEEVKDQEVALNDLLVEKNDANGKETQPHTPNDNIQDEIARLAAECFATDALENHGGVTAARGGCNYFGDCDSSCGDYDVD